VDAGHEDVAIMEDAEEAAVATADMVGAEAAAMHAVEAAGVAEAAMTATLSHARLWQARP
jgi:hypothetical protein